MTTLFFLLGPALAAEFVLLPEGGPWRYLDDGADPGPDWINPPFDDGAWAVGDAPLGYANDGIVTTVGYGPDPTDKHVTTWFRADFTATGTADLTRMTLSLRVDDGAVVYLNGAEVHRQNLPAGPITAATLATTAVVNADEDAYTDVTLATTHLVEGDNTLAIEVHQQAPTSSDLTLDAALVGSDERAASTTIVRGPYLQQTGDDGTVLRWRTADPTDAIVWIGAAPGALSEAARDPAVGVDHEVTLTGLGPSTTWTYAVGSTTDGVLAGDDADHVFTTHPTPGHRVPVRIWALGDAGTANGDQEAVRDAFLSFSGGVPPDVVLLLGDNAYENGTDTEYQDAVFDMYADTLRRVAAWSTFGNHDGYSASAATQSGPYFDVFSLPAAGEAGGVPSGTEAYYSFDVANIHFICLDSTGSDRSAGSAMVRWLEADLEATFSDWVIAFWHHPPYSKGSHDSDWEGELVDMRENVLPVLEGSGVDLVLSGHSHAYERSMLLDGHYGTSGELAPWMVLDDRSGSRSDGATYEKPTLGPAPHEGSVYVVAGSSGKTSGGPLNHPAMFVSLDALGSLVVDVDGSSLDAVFLREDGTVQDRFSIDKGGDAPPTRPPELVLDPAPSPSEGERVTLRTTATDPDRTPVTVAWDLGDGTIQAGLEVTHTWIDDGVYDVIVTATDGDGERTEVVLPVTVTNADPILEAITLPAAFEGTPVTVSATASDPGTADVLTTSWSFGDGGAAVGATVTHTFRDDGAYRVELTVRDDDGGETTDARVVNVANQAPVILSTEVPSAVEMGVEAELRVLALDPGLDDVLTATWDLGDGTVAEGMAVHHAWATDGTYVVGLTVADDDGASVTRGFEVLVAGAPVDTGGTPLDPDAPDTDTPIDTDRPVGPGDAADTGCRCAAAPPPAPGSALLAASLLLVRRRRRA